MNFQVGDRVVFVDEDNQGRWSFVKHMASMGNEYYALLNAKDDNGHIQPMTGTICNISKHPLGWSYYLHPDGWDETTQTRGFEVDVNRLRPAREGEHYPCPRVSGLGEVIV